MTRVTADQSISLDGFTAGPNQTPDEPLGERGEQLHTWMFEAAEDHAAEREADPGGVRLRDGAQHVRRTR